MLRKNFVGGLRQDRLTRWWSRGWSRSHLLALQPNLWPDPSRPGIHFSLCKKKEKAKGFDSAKNNSTFHNFLIWEKSRKSGTFVPCWKSHPHQKSPCHVASVPCFSCVWCWEVCTCPEAKVAAISRKISSRKQKGRCSFCISPALSSHGTWPCSDLPDFHFLLSISSAAEIERSPLEETHTQLAIHAMFHASHNVHLWSY